MRSWKISFRRDANAPAMLFARIWLSFKPGRERLEALRRKELSIDLITWRNAAVMCLVFMWAGFYFLFQYNFTETPRYYGGVLFSVAPNLFLQQFRFGALDVFCSYFYVYGMALLYMFFWGMAFASEDRMWKLALGFLFCWMAQGTLQVLIAAASPVRIPGNGVDFIRYEVFPLSDAMIGIKYGAIPSGHVGAPVILFLAGRLRNIKWAQWLALLFFIAFWFTILYLGEHYIIDGLASLIVYPLMFLGAWKLAGRYERWRDAGREAS